MIDFNKNQIHKLSDVDQLKKVDLTASHNQNEEEKNHNAIKFAPSHVET